MEMTTLREAAQQALEALLTPSGAQACSTCQNGPENEYCCRMEMWSAITALRAALAQQDEPAQEPVATLIAQRDALLEALKAMLEQFNYHTISGIVHDESSAIDRARAAIRARTP